MNTTSNTIYSFIRKIIKYDFYLDDIIDWVDITSRFEFTKMFSPEDISETLIVLSGDMHLPERLGTLCQSDNISYVIEIFQDKDKEVVLLMNNLRFLYINIKVNILDEIRFLDMETANLITILYSVDVESDYFIKRLSLNHDESILFKYLRCRSVCSDIIAHLNSLDSKTVKSINNLHVQ